MSQVADNLKYLLWLQQVAPEDWPTQLAAWAKCDIRRAELLLRGEMLQPIEQRRIAETLSVPEEELLFSRLVEAGTVDILLENIRYLTRSLGHGQKKALAFHLGVHPTTISRWASGELRLTKGRLDALSRYFRLPAHINLETDSLFLSGKPATDLDRRAWLHKRIDEMDAATIQDLFPALERMLVDA